ncbi:hypothetical protein Cgig2_010654 [Carnegiea gigantea]|uniref:F-box domain-containing protein n=1 Tax=Carnegiea gigantea TaxID=171969 RepID=A0A9Q1GSQ0_9CARY|nr:hypothetical protein Cgig2_010654 [Carnegiea gigantea]
MESNPELEQLCLQGEGGDGSGLEKVDRISNLPDEIIRYMLSFVKPQEAVRTSILSKRWRYLWKGSITRISLCYTEGIFTVHRFENFVHQVLRHCTSMNLEEFNLYCPEHIDFSFLSGWIRRAQECDIKKLDLHVDMRELDMLPEWAFPRCILTCTTLVALELGSYFDIEVPDTVSCFPHLKSIHLYFVFPNHYDAIHRLLSCCPVLEELQLHGQFDSLKMLTFHISIPTLRRFALWIKDDDPAAINDNKIIINTPNLEYLSIFDNSFSRYVLKNLDRVHNVDIGYEATCLGDLLPVHINHLFELFKGIGETKLLILRTHPLEVLDSALSYPWPTFPSLEEFCYIEHQYIPLQSVPNCLLQCLKKIGIQPFIAENEDEMQIVKYLLNNARVLELMVIGYPPMKQNVIEKLLAIPRASKTCDMKLSSTTEKAQYKNKIHPGLYNFWVSFCSQSCASNDEDWRTQQWSANVRQKGMKFKIAI